MRKQFLMVLVLLNLLCFSLVPFAFGFTVIQKDSCENDSSWSYLTWNHQHNYTDYKEGSASLELQQPNAGIEYWNCYPHPYIRMNPSGSLTVLGFWLKWLSHGGSQMGSSDLPAIGMYDNVSTNFVRLRRYGIFSLNSYVSFYLDNGVGSVISSVQDIGVWHWVQIGWDNSSMKAMFYYDGVNYGNQIFIGAVFHYSSTSFLISIYGYGDVAPIMQIDYIRITDNWDFTGSPPPPPAPYIPASGGEIGTELTLFLLAGAIVMIVGSPYFAVYKYKEGDLATGLGVAIAGLTIGIGLLLVAMGS